MKNIATVLILIAVLAIGSARSEAAEDRAYFPPVIMYHDIKLFALNGFDVTLKDFTEQLDWLRKSGYITLSMDEFVSTLESGKKFPPNSVLITFDDGYQGAATFGANEIRRQHMKATFFVIPEMLGKSLEGYPYMTEEELLKLAESDSFSIGSHTIDHPHLDQLSSEELTRQLVESKATLEKMIGKPVISIAYPYGDYNLDVIDGVISAGYSAAFAGSDRGMFDRAARWSIPRIYMGLMLSGNKQKLFKQYIRTYKKMPPEAFAERFAPLNR